MIELNLLWLGVLSFTGIAALHDHRTGHIPNRLVCSGLGLGACQQLFCVLGRLGPERLMSVGLVGVVSGVMVCAAVPFVLFKLGVLGGGDVKLLGCIGAFLGPTQGLELCFAAFVVAALYLPGRLVYAGELLRRFSGWAQGLARRWSPTERHAPPPTPEPLQIAFAPCVFVAAALVAFTHWSQA